MSNRGILAAIAAVLVGAALTGQGTSTSRANDRPGTAAAGWLEFRGDLQNSGVSHGPAPLLKAVRWRFVADREVLNSPVFADGVLYFGSRGGFLYALRASDGSKIWERRHARPPENDEGPGGFTFSNAMIRGDRLVIASEDGHVYCVSRTSGDLLWKKHLGGAGATDRIWASPKSDGVRVFIGSPAGHFFALALDTGALVWKAWIGDEIGGSAALLGGDVMVAAKDKRLYVFDTATGARRGKVELGGTTMSTPSVALGCAFLRISGGRLVCVDLVNHTVRWTTEVSPTAYAQTGPAHDGDVAYVTNGGVLAAVDADGKIVWQMRAKTGFDSSPILAGAFVILGGGDATLAAVDRKSGARVREIALGEALIATPTVVEGVVYAPSKSGIVFAVE